MTVRTCAKDKLEIDLALEVLSEKKKNTYYQAFYN